MVAAGALAASALLFFLGTGLHPIGWLAWFAPFPPLLVGPRLPARRAFFVATGAWVLGALNMWPYLRGVIGTPLPIAVLAMVLPACVFGAAALMHRRLIRYDRPWLATLSVPVLWVTYEYLYSSLSPHGTFGLVAYSQVDWLPMLQIVSVTGISGLSFCLFLFPAAFATLCIARDRRRAVAQALAAAVVIAGVLLFGMWRLASLPSDGDLVAVTLISSDALSDRFPETDDAALRLYRQYAANIDTIAERLDAEIGPAASSGAPDNASRIVVLPEKIGVLSEGALATADELFRAAAARASATVVAGFDRGSATVRRNEARVYRPGASAPMVYDKHHLIPGLEDVDEAGTTTTLIPGPSASWGVQICKDMDFPALSRRYAGDRIGLLLVPAWDFDVDGWLHSRMAIMRGVESGFAIARAAKQGRLTLSDNRGRIVAERSSAEGPFSTLVATMRVTPVRTLYAQAGDWFSWLSVAAFIAVLASALRAPVAHPSRQSSD